MHKALYHVDMLQKFKHNEMWCLPMQPWVGWWWRVLFCVVVLPGEGVGVVGGGWGWGNVPPPALFL